MYIARQKGARMVKRACVKEYADSRDRTLHTERPTKATQINDNHGDESVQMLETR